MPSIEIGEDQATYLVALRDELAGEYGGPYSTITHGDAIQFLIDRYEDGSAETTPRDVDAGTRTSSADRLEAMMNLLAEHEDHWEETDAEQGKYAVTLPDGSVEHVRTKDDVKAVLFRNY